MTAKPDEQAAFEDWLYRVCPSGDVDTVNDLWKTSADHEDFLFDLEEWEATNPPSPAAPLVGADGGTTQGDTQHG